MKSRNVIIDAIDGVNSYGNLNSEHNYPVCVMGLP